MLGRAVWLCHLGAGQCCVGAGEVAPVPDPQPCGDSVPASRGCGDGRRDESGVLSPVEMCWGGKWGVGSFPFIKGRGGRGSLSPAHLWVCVVCCAVG